MSPTISYGRDGRAHRYYVSAPLQKGAKREEDDSLRRIPAQKLDEVVFDAVGRPARQTLDPAGLRTFLRRLTVHPDRIEFTVVRSAFALQTRGADAELAAIERRLLEGEEVQDNSADPHLALVVIPVLLRTRGGRSWMAMPDGKAPNGKTRTDPTLVWGLSRAHRALGSMGLRPDGRQIPGQTRKPAASPYERAMAAVAFLAPDIQAAIIAGGQPAGLKLDYLLKADLPLAWADQRTALGF